MEPGLDRLPVAAQLAEFVTTRTWDHLSEAARSALKMRVLDALGCAIGALDSHPMNLLRRHVEELGGSPACTLVGGGRTAPDRAALYNGALVRYLDFNDSYLAPGETCHPSDNLGAVLAAAEWAGASGRDLLLALAVAYQVQCRLAEVAPVRSQGFDHTTHGAYAAAAGVARALGLDQEAATHALAISGAALNALRVTRTGALSHWKGLAAPFAGAAATEAAFLARQGITGPLEVFEGTKGLMEAITGPFEVDWANEDLERVRWTILKRYNAEIHSQSALEALLDLQAEHGVDPDDIERFELEVFQVAFDIIGGGEEGAKTMVRTKEEADHSLPYLLAVAVLDGQVLPAQFAPDRILAPDVQQLLRRVEVRPADDLSRRFPKEHPCRLRVHLRNGRVLDRAKSDYAGFHTRPMSWDAVTEKFLSLARPAAAESLCWEIVDATRGLESVEVSSLADLLSSVYARPLDGTVPRVK